ncbi:MAG: hypothetical protein B7Y02_15535 [Rhodobacterales bacterium 17-64-5]|nr:MAG: hypothetical protein B7Y02_15535 [Rhodobacterales bacterium 17-64-5]
MNLRQPVLTVRDVSFSLHGGEVLGLVGESGGGKSTLLRAVAGLWPPSAARPAAAYPAAACPAAACPVTVRLGLSAEIG